MFRVFFSSASDNVGPGKSGFKQTAADYLIDHRHVT